MASQHEFVNHVVEIFGAQGSARAKRMFGGFGLYCDDLFVGIVADDVLYLRTDDQNRTEFERAGGEPFRYSKRGKLITFNYHRVPDDALDGAQQMQPWAHSAISAALRSHKPAAARKRGPNKIINKNK